MPHNECHPVLQYLRHSLRALQLWTLRRWGIAAVLSILIGIALGIVTVLIPNPFFQRDIPPTMWSYPVWLVTSTLSGILTATYIHEPSMTVSDKDKRHDHTPGLNESHTEDSRSAEGTASSIEDVGSSSVWGMIGTFGAWFAIGCPVCNKLALLALGYSGAITYFAPVQPWLAVVSLALLVAGVVVRLSGEIACPLPRRVA